MFELINFKSKISYSWAKCELNDEKYEIKDIFLFEKIKLYLNLCPDQRLKNIYKKGKRIIDKELNIIHLLLTLR